jgi:DNA-binding MarR family transcriptional regulator
VIIAAALLVLAWAERSVLLTVVGVVFTGLALLVNLYDVQNVFHQRHRLGILTIAAESKRVEFGYLKEVLELTGGNLSRHLTVLVDAGLLDMEKGYDGKRPRTWVTITRAGRQALADEIAALRALVARHSD